jgi:hypothetical protein
MQSRIQHQTFPCQHFIPIITNATTLFDLNQRERDLKNMIDECQETVDPRTQDLDDIISKCDETIDALCYRCTCGG